MNRSRFSYHRILSQLRRLLRNDHLILSVLGGVIGCLTGGAIILFREFILLVQLGLFGSASERLFQHAETIPWWHILLIPAAGVLR